MIRRREESMAVAKGELAFETATFSLTTDVPRPTDRRADDRLLSILPPGKLTAENGAEHLCRIRNISAGGMTVELSAPVQANTKVTVELDSHRSISGDVVWVRDTCAGIKFDQKTDIREILSKGKPRIGFRPRPARLEVLCGATIQVDGLYYKVEMRDISLGGMKVELDGWRLIKRDVVVTVESLRPIKGTVVWCREGFTGILFHKPLKFEELAEWLGKRLEVASLRAGSTTLTPRR